MGKDPSSKANVEDTQDKCANHQREECWSYFPEVFVFFINADEFDKVPRTPDDRGEEKCKAEDD